VTHPAEAADFDEIERQIAEAEGTQKLDDVKLGSGEDIPEPLRGKSVAELVEMTKGTMQAITTADQARKQAEAALAEANARRAALEALAGTGGPGAAPAGGVSPHTPPASQGGGAAAQPPQLSEEAFQKMYEESPAKAFKALTEETERKLQANLDARLRPLTTGSAATAESSDQIDTFVSRLPDRSVMASPKAWDDLVSYIAGMPDNRKRWLDAELAKRTGDAEAAAQAGQAAAAGPTVSGQRAPAPTQSRALTVDSLDPTQKEICRVMGISEAEYVKWDKVGQHG
jgi:hypothetical protein